MPPEILSASGPVRLARYPELQSDIAELTSSESSSIFAETYSHILESSVEGAEDLTRTLDSPTMCCTYYLMHLLRTAPTTYHTYYLLATTPVLLTAHCLLLTAYCLRVLGSEEAALSATFESDGVSKQFEQVEHATLFTPHSSLLTPHPSLLTPHSSLHTPYSSLLTPHSSLHLLTPHSSLLTLHSSLFPPPSSLLIPHSSLLTLPSSLITPHASLPPTHYSL